MTQEEKQLLLKDLCGRLLYGVKIYFPSLSAPIILDEFILSVARKRDEDFKPYLRPMSSMTAKEKEEYTSYCFEQPFLQKNKMPDLGSVPMCIDWLNAHHFDYRGLIPIGLALEASEGIY